MTATPTTTERLAAEPTPWMSDLVLAELRRRCFDLADSVTAARSDLDAMASTLPFHPEVRAADSALSLVSERARRREHGRCEPSDAGRLLAQIAKQAKVYVEHIANDPEGDCVAENLDVLARLLNQMVARHREFVIDHEFGCMSTAS